MKEIGKDSYINVTIPGSVYSALLENALIENPYYRDNENEALKLSEKDYEFVTEFAVSGEILNCPYAVLKFFGLDTIADIWLNGEHLGYVDNMHREWEYEVKSLLEKEGNILKIIFHSPVKYILEDTIINRITPQITRNLLEKAVAANRNAICVWGGGFYPHDSFWDTCDELGLVVWVDFAFACAINMLTEEAFEENITIEFIQNIKRIRNHAFLGCMAWK